MRAAPSLALAVLIAAALVAEPGVAGGAVGQLNHAQFAGSPGGSTRGGLQLLGIPQRMAADDSSFEIKAASMHVQPYRLTCTHLPDTCTGVDVREEPGPAFDVARASGHTIRFGEDSWALAYPNGTRDAVPPRLSLAAPLLNVSPKASIDFDISTRVEPARTNQYVSERVYLVNEPTLQARFSASGQTWEIRGDFRYEFYDHDLRLRDAQGQIHEVRTGEERDTADPTGTTYSRTTTRVVIDVKDGTLLYHSRGRAVQVNLAVAEYDLKGPVRFVEAFGSVILGGREQRLAGESLEVAGTDLQVVAMPVLRGEDGPVIGSTLAGDVDSAAVDGSPVQVAAVGSAVDTRAFASPLVAFLSILAIVGFGLFALAARRRESPHRAEARYERAAAYFAEGSYRRAEKMARRVLQATPSHLDGTLVRAMSLLKLGRASEAVDFLESQRTVLPEDHGMVSLVQALSLLDAGRDHDAVGQLKRALRANPLLLQEIRGTNLFARALENPAMREFLHVDPSQPSPSYA